MTSREACATWLKEEGSRHTTWQELWDAACEWQKKRDATICEADEEGMGKYYARIIRKQDE